MPHLRGHTKKKGQSGLLNLIQHLKNGKNLSVLSILLWFDFHQRYRANKNFSPYLAFWRGSWKQSVLVVES